MKVFDELRLNEYISREYKYIITIGTYDEDTFAYIFYSKVGEDIRILLCKEMRDENEFKQEVENLAKYFNAYIVKQ